MENVETAIAMIGRLKDLGIEWSIDDFGTGYSSLSQLHCFPASTLKIDRSFVMGLGESGGNVEIVHTILMLARALGMRVVAEGIETEEQLAQLRTLGCESGQGYLFSKPLAAPEATALLGSNLAFPIPKEPAFVFTEA